MTVCPEPLVSLASYKTHYFTHWLADNQLWDINCLDSSAGCYITPTENNWYMLLSHPFISLWSFPLRQGMYIISPLDIISCRVYGTENNAIWLWCIRCEIKIWYLGQNLLFIRGEYESVSKHNIVVNAWNKVISSYEKSLAKIFLNTSAASRFSGTFFYTISFVFLLMVSDNASQLGVTIKPNEGTGCQV